MNKLNEDLKNKLIPKNGNLHTYWYYKNWFGKKIKTFTVVCGCGCNRLLVAENGIRCVECGDFHSHNSFIKAKEKAKKAKHWDNGKIEQVPQPFLEQWKIWKMRRQIKSKIIINL